MSGENSESKATAFKATALVLQDGTIVSLAAERHSITGAFFKVTGLLWEQRSLLLIGLVVGILLGITAAWVVPQEYIAKVVVEPGPVADSLDQAGLLSNLSSLSPFGAQIPQMEKDFLQLLQSNAAAAALLKNHSIVTRIFPDEWDASRNTWHPPTSPFALAVRAFRVILGQPSWLPPNVDRVKLFLEKNLVISPIGDGSLQQVSFTARNPDDAATFLKATVRAADDYLRLREATRAAASIKYWQAQLNNATSQDLRNALIAAIIDSQRRAVFADVDLPFSIDVTDPIMVPDAPAGPRGILLVLAGALIGSLLAAAFAIYRVLFAPLVRSRNRS